VAKGLEIFASHVYRWCVKPTSLHLNLTAVFEPVPEGGFLAGFEEFPDVFSEGETIEKAKANLLDALELVMSYHRDEARKAKGDSSAIVRETFELASA
jgi:predicted RNase H-like HicB family nuclease